MLTVCYFENHCNLYKLILIFDFGHVKIDIFHNVLNVFEVKSENLECWISLKNFDYKIIFTIAILRQKL